MKGWQLRSEWSSLTDPPRGFALDTPNTPTNFGRRVTWETTVCAFIDFLYVGWLKGPRERVEFYLSDLSLFVGVFGCSQNLALR